MPTAGGFETIKKGNKIMYETETETEPVTI